MLLGFRRSIPLTCSALIFLGCGSASPVRPSSPDMAAQAGAARVAGRTSADTPILWHCLASGTLWQPADCPPRVIRSLQRADAALTAPGGPADLVSAVSGARVTLTWSAPAVGDPPASYVVEAGSAAGLADLANFDTGNAALSLTVDSVPAGTYYVRVRARNSGGTGVPSNEIVLAVSGTGSCATRPNAPSGLAAAVIGASVQLSWSAPAGGCAATSYAIEAGSAAGLANLANVSTGSAATTFSATGVAAGTYFVRVKAVNAGGQSAASNEVTLTIGTAAPSTSCASWANLQRGSGVPPAPSNVASQRSALYGAGGGIKAVGSKYYAAYFPSGFATSARRRVMVALHGTGGSPEAEWNDWQAQVQARNWGYLGLKYLDDATGAYDDELTIYANIKTMIDDVRASCDLANTALFLVGFSRGSAESIPVAYLDLVDRRLVTAVGNNSGAWAPGGAPPPPLPEVAARGNRTAMSGLKYWMYCGELDFVQGWSMCDGMVGARDFLQTYGATVAALYRDPSGTHGGLTRNSSAMSQMFSYFEGLP